MSYKTILVHVDKSRHAANRVKLAARMAVREEAHLIGVAPTGLSRYIFQAGMSDIGNFPAQLEEHMDILREQGKEALNLFEDAAQGAGAESVESRLLDDEAGSAAILQARYSDLVVIGQTDPEEPSPAVPPDFPEYVVLNSGRPVLIVPYAGRFETIGRRVLVAWDASISATRAVTNAIPFLKQAEIVEVAVFNPEQQGDAHGEMPGSDIALYLARHNVKVDVLPQKTDIDVGSALLSMASDLASDMIVMGGYGHSRFREILLGGVTRTVLGSMTVPVLMSH